MARPIDNPPNPWSSTHVEWIDAPPPSELKVYHEEAVSILSENDSPDLPFRYSLNPYRGCFHACAYCYARPSHQYWDFGAGTDFERKIVVKTNAAVRLRETFVKRSWVGDTILFSGNTDCYQPMELSYGLTRACLQTCAEFRNPVAIITKGALIRRDVDVLAQLAREAHAHVTISLAFSDTAMARAIEPSAPSPEARFAAMRVLADAGVDVGVAIAPVIPGLNDDQVVEVLERAAEAGARRAFYTLLRLPGPVEQIFVSRLEEALPLRAKRVLNGLRDTRGGQLSDSRFGHRMTGRGARWDMTAQIFETTCRRLGLQRTDRAGEAWMFDPTHTTFVRPGSQMSLF